MGTIDDAAAGMMGIIGTSAMIGVGAVAGMSMIKMMNRMGNSVTRTRKRTRKNKY